MPEPSVAVASTLLTAFELYQNTFLAITLRAQHRFENSSYQEAQEDAELRLGLYQEFVNYVTMEISPLLASWPADSSLWIEAKATYSELVDTRYDRELAQTFFNSVTRHIHGTVGVDSGIEYFDSDFAFQPLGSREDLVCTYRVGNDGLANTLQHVLGTTAFVGRFRAIRSECSSTAVTLTQTVNSQVPSATIEELQILQPLFFRDGMAYILGRVGLKCGNFLPFVLPLESTPAGIGIDAVLSTEDQVSILFSFARSYFFVPSKYHRQVIQFLKELLPRKRVDELYSSIGHHKHGKTELHRGLRWHLARSGDQFEFTAGKRGMVMIAFTLPSYEVVFKVIRDRAQPPKQCNRQRVLDSYDLVFKHDRVGRMVDAQEFVNLEFRKDRFAPDLLEELRSEAGDTVSVVGDVVTIRHLYTERRVTPLDVFIKEATTEKAAAAIVDYGDAIKELAAANIFPGDLFLKNFGVTRHERVVFYDYDELCLLTDCNFRHFPHARYDYQELESEPWFAVRENDIFPEEIRRFLGIPAHLRSFFEEKHSDLFTPDFWRKIQNKHNQCEFIEIRPYKDTCKLR